MRKNILLLGVTFFVLGILSNTGFCISWDKEKEDTLIKLRSEYKTLSLEDAQSMLKKYNFFSRKGRFSKKHFNEDGDFANKYELKIINDANVVVDHATGLMWHQSGSKLKKYKKLLKWIEELNSNGYAGYSDWRLPTLEEAASLLESTKMNGRLYIDAAFSKKQFATLTGDIYKERGQKMWKVSFVLGCVMQGPLDYSITVRPVRSIK